jgi:hypothetical protein
MNTYGPPKRQNPEDTVYIEKGAMYGKLTVITESGRAHRQAEIWVRCECGVQKAVTTYNLINGCVKSCGCTTRGTAASVRYYGRQYSTSSACTVAGISVASVCNRVRTHKCTHQEAFDYYVAKKAAKKLVRKVTTADFV